MLKICYGMNQLNFQLLMAVYEEGNRENGRENYPLDSPEVQLDKAIWDFESYLREDFFRVNGAYYAVLEDAGLYRSAVRMEPYEDGWLLEALETHPSCRRQGYARKLLRGVLAQMPEGACVYSHVGKRNAASLATHLGCGFQIHRDYAKYVDGTVSQYAYTMKFTICL